MGSRIYLLDLYKFFAALGIAVLHLHWQYIPQAYLFVEFFFICSGFMIGLGKDRYIERGWLKSIEKRLGAFYCQLVIAIACCCVLYGVPHPYKLINAMLMLPDIGWGGGTFYFWILVVFRCLCGKFWIVYWSNETF